MREIWFKIAHTSGTRVYNLAAAFVILVVTARWLGPEGRGNIAAITAWAGLFGTLGSLSLGQVAIYRATEQRHKAWLAPTLGSLLFLTGIITLIGWGTALGLYGIDRGSIFNGLPPDGLWIGFLTLPFLLWEQGGSSLLIAVDRLDIYNNAQLIARTANIVLVVIALALNGGVAGVLVTMLIAQAIISLAGLRYLIRRAGSAIRPDSQTIRDLLRGGFKLHFNAVGNFLILYIGVLIINHYRGAAETGYYQLAVQLAGVLLVVPQSAAVVLYSKIAQQGPDAAWGTHRKILVWTMVSMVGVGLVAGAAAPWAIPFVMGEAFAPSVTPFTMLLLGLIGMAFAAMMAPQWIGRGLFLQVATIGLAVGSLNLIASFLLVPAYGMYGSVLSILLTYILFSIPINGGMAIWCEVRYRRNYRGEPLAVMNVVAGRAHE